MSGFREGRFTAAYMAAAQRWDVRLDERTVALSSIWVESSYWE
ncbi:hypothetical protein [Streptomyces sp. NPDC089795]